MFSLQSPLWKPQEGSLSDEFKLLPTLSFLPPHSHGRSWEEPVHQDWSRTGPVEGLGQMLEQKEGLKARAVSSSARAISGQALPGQPSVLCSRFKWSTVI